MEQRQIDHAFGATIAQRYESHLVPLIFEPYATALAERVVQIAPSRVLEIAAGTGVVTRALASRLSPSVEIVATDLNQAMLDRAMAVGTSRPVQWRQADALALPFDDGTFDAVVCQFGVMFFPDKRRAFAEARRVLTTGGAFLFSVWDRIEENEFAATVADSLASQFPDDPPSFMQRTPHGYFDLEAIATELRDAGFTMPATFHTTASRSRATSPHEAAVAYCEGTPLRTEIERQAGTALADVTDRATRALEERFGSGAIDGKTQAILVTVAKEDA